MEKAIEIVNDWIAINDPTAVLDLSNLLLKELPNIPSNCEILFCQYNKLTALPQLPNCTRLYCHSNELITLSELPKCQQLWCFNNELTTLPQLTSCQVLSCDDNELITLPELPNCRVLRCNYGNKYLHINKLQAKKFASFGAKETPNYNKYAKIIQRNYKNHLRKKYHDIISQYIFKGPTSLVCLFAV